MNRQQSGPEVSWRGKIAFALLVLTVLNLGMIAVGVGRYPALLSQPGARTFVAEPIGVLVVYAIAVVCIAKTHGTYWILRTAVIFGLLVPATSAVLTSAPSLRLNAVGTFQGRH